MPRLLITGAGGFIGGFLVKEALQQGFDVWAGIRKSSSRRYLQDPRIHFLYLPLTAEKELEKSLNNYAKSENPFDAVIHAAGVTKALHRDTFFKVNTDGTKNLAHLLLSTGALRQGGRFVFISSLSVCGPIAETNNTLITLQQTPLPNTAYGESKLAAEKVLESIHNLNYIILRPTGVYGPHEQDYKMMIDAIRKHIDFAVGRRPQKLTFIYVNDVVSYALAALTEGRKGGKYFLTDGDSHSSKDFSQLIAKELGVKHVFRLTIPLGIAKTVCLISEWISTYTGKMSALNNDKFNIFKQRNWLCDITPTYNDLNYRPQYSLKRGVHNTVNWYKNEYLSE